MGEQRVRRLQNPPDAGLLMTVKLNRLACAGQCQVIAIERAQPGVVERVVVETAKPFAPRIVRPNPFLEPFLDASITDSSNTATVKKNQNHGSRSRCAKNWMGAKACAGLPARN